MWDEIRHDLWSHLQIEDGLVHSWGEAHHTISAALLATVKNERQEMRRLVGALRALSSGPDREPQAAGDRSSFAQTLLALARTLDSHVERYDGRSCPRYSAHCSTNSELPSANRKRGGFTSESPASTCTGENSGAIIVCTSP